MIRQRTETVKEAEDPLRLTRPEWRVLLVLAAVHLTHILDFVIIMPLGKRFQDELDITVNQFGYLVTAYGVSAGLASLLATSFIDRVDRKLALLGLYGGLTASTLLCAFAPTFWLLVLARALAGAFGGVAAACVLMVIGDVIPDVRRGLANGVVMSAFSVASIIGLPAGLWLAASTGYGWRAPFAVLGGLCVVVLVLSVLALPPMRGHLKHRETGDQASLWEIVSETTHVRAYLLMIFLMVSSFLVVPYLADYLQANAGLGETELPLVYLFGGLATFLSTPFFGRLADRRGKLPVFRVLALLTAIPFLTMTNLPRTALPVILLVTTLLMVLSSGRMVPAMALITASAVPQHRGRFLSINSSVQQLAIGLASFVASMILTKNKQGEIIGYPLAGVLAAGATLFTVYLAGRLRPAEGGLEAVDSLDEEPSAASEPEVVGPPGFRAAVPVSES